MINLAGSAICDPHIRDELLKARLVPEPGEGATHEVTSTLQARLGPLTFRRAWTYWVVQGPVPMAAAVELYADPIGLVDVRAGGDCACRPPSTWATHYAADGREIVLMSNRAELEKFAAKKNLPDLAEKCRESLATLHFADDPAADAARSEVNCYHIDSLAGLRLFVDVCRKHGLDGTPTAAERGRALHEIAKGAAERQRAVADAARQAEAALSYRERTAILFDDELAALLALRAALAAVA